MSRFALLLFVLLALEAAPAETTLVVRVVDPLGEPLHGISVDLRRSGQSVDGLRLTPRTDKDGRCRFTSLEGGRYYLSIHRFPGWNAEAHQTVEISGLEETVEREVRPEPTRTYRVSGVVEDFAADRFGQPALFLQGLDRVDPQIPPTSCFATLIGPDGSFRIRAPQPGVYRIAIDELSSGSRGCSGLRPTPAQVVIGDEPQRLRLRAPEGFER